MMGLKKKQDKAKFRVMHHRNHDEAEWHVDGKDELDNISDQYKYLDKRFKEEF